METTKRVLKGGEFLIKEADPKSIFIPEDFDEEQKMIAATCEEFIKKEVTPNLDRIDKQEEGLMQELLDKAGELGIIGITIPEKYNGFGKNFVTGMLSTEKIGPGHSFTVAMGAQNGIGVLPILYYGNEKQKEKYIPKLANGEWKASYCLTEPDAGSDANSGKTKAVLSDDEKHYIINGQKMWITNAGFADVFTVFAKIGDDDNLSAFIVEKGYKGLDLNPEEKKMCIKGSSTRQVFFNDCKVPVENLLGKRGGGFKIALYILNIGRIKLAAGVLGAAKESINQSVQYANQRSQFGKSLGTYGAIKHKIAKQTIKTFALESALYRASQNVEARISEEIENGKSKAEADLIGIREYAVEAAILKVYGSETLNFVVDEAVQIYGGMGVSAEAPVERAYRDARINRIFEGTNEINRMLILDMMLKKAMKGELDLLNAAKTVAGELMSIPDMDDDNEQPFAEEHKYIKQFKKVGLMIAGSAFQKFQKSISDEQEILMDLADILIQIYLAESMLLRVEKMAGKLGEEKIDLQYKMAKVFIYEAAAKINHSGREAINAFAEGDEGRMMLIGLKRFTKTNSLNTKSLRREIADKALEENKYCF